jgi:hypothetical protein
VFFPSILDTFNVHINVQEQNPLHVNPKKQCELLYTNTASCLHPQYGKISGSSLSSKIEIDGRKNLT